MTESHSELVLRDRAGCMWVLGSMFFGGGVLVSTLMLGFGTGARPHGWGALAAWSIAIVHTCAGIWLIVSSPNISARLLRDEAVMMVTRRWPFVRKERRIHLDDIRHVIRREDKDSDGDPVFVLELRLSTGERLRLHSVALHTRDDVDQGVEKLRAWGRGRLIFRSEQGPANELRERG